jgi:hypothetical protein
MAPRGVGNRNQAWKTDIDSRVSSGGQLGLSYLQGLASQYGIPYSQILGFVNKSGYQLGTKAAAAAQPAPTPSTPAFSAGSYDKFKLGDVSGLTSYLQSQLNPGSGVSNPLAIMTGSRGGYDNAMGMLADYMGVQNINSKQEINKALSILGGANNSFAQALSPGAGIKSYDSLNDYLQVLGGGIGARGSGSGAGTLPNTMPGTGAGGAGSGMGDTAYSPEMPTMPDAPEFKYTPGGPGASVDAAATGFRRKRSSARVAGLTTKGTSRFKITGQTGKSSGLNIGKP